MNFDDDERRELAQLITKIIRKDFGLSNNARKPCHVCKRYAVITEKHHLISVSEVVNVWVDLKVDLNELNRLLLPTIWLCPNHHTMFHAMDTADEKRRFEIVMGTSLEEGIAIKDLFELRNARRRELAIFLAGAKKNE
jgi:hypothetical protein